MPEPPTLEARVSSSWAKRYSSRFRSSQLWLLLTWAPSCQVIQVTFETGSMRFKSLEQALFVGAGRFIVDERGLTVEYRISKVCKGAGAASEDAAAGEAATAAADDGSRGGETSNPAA